MRFELGFVSLIVTGAMVRVIIHAPARRVSKQKGKPGEREELFVGTQRESEARLVMCD